MAEEEKIQQLIKQAQAGETSAFGEIYETYSDNIYNFLFGKLHHKQTCEDLMHTVFLKAWTNLNRYKPQKSAKFSTWLFQIANYTLIDHWRVHKETLEITKVENLSRFALDPKTYEDYEFLWIAISELPLEQQTVLDLRFKQELSVAETANIMGKSQVAIRVLQHRAISRLKEKIEKKLYV